MFDNRKNFKKIRNCPLVIGQPKAELASSRIKQFQRYVKRVGVLLDNATGGNLRLHHAGRKHLNVLVQMIDKLKTQLTKNSQTK